MPLLTMYAEIKRPLEMDLPAGRGRHGIRPGLLRTPRECELPRLEVTGPEEKNRSCKGTNKHFLLD